MRTLDFNYFKDKYKIFAYIFVYVAYFSQILLLEAKQKEITLFVVVYLLVILILNSILFNTFTICFHQIIYFLVIGFPNSFDTKTIIFFSCMFPFYSVLIYTFLSIFGFDKFITKKICS